MLFKRILVHVDAPSDGDLLQGAAALARGAGARLTVVDSVYEFSWLVRLTLRDPDVLRDRLLELKRTRLEELVRPLEADGIPIEVKVLHGRTSLAIIREVLRQDHDLVIKHVKGVRSHREGFLGTTALRLLRKCPCAVLLVERGKPLRFEHAVAAVDVTPDDDEHVPLNRKIMETACGLQEVLGGRLSVAHAWSVYGEVLLKEHMQPEEFQALLEGSREKSETGFKDFLRQYQLGEDVGVHLVHGDPSFVLPRLIRELGADLLVLGTIARGGLPGFLFGNTAEAVLDELKCSVLAVKTPSFVCPIPREDV